MTRRSWQRIVEPDSIAFVLSVALLLRLAILPLFYDDYNYWAFGVFTNFLLHGQNPYHIVTQDPTLLNINPWRYPPLYFLFTAPAAMTQILSGQTILYLAALKLPLAVADIVSTFYLYKILTRFLARRRALAYSAFFALNPLVIFASSGGGFNDPIAVAFTVASVFYLLRYKDRSGPEKHDLVISALFLGLGVATKIYPILLTPVLIRELNGIRSRLYYLLFTLVPAILFSTPFLLWDYASYLELLTIRNVGGQHPLFPSVELGGFTGGFLLSLLVVLLVLVYFWRASLTARLTLVFLWINLAIFATSINYMVWGIPFFTWYVAEHRRLLFLPLSPIITLFVALIFQGSYNSVGGSAGIFYWTYHLWRLPVVLYIQFPWLGLVEFWALSLSEVVAGYFFITVFFKFELFHWGIAQKATNLISSLIARKRIVLSVLLLGSVVVSWGLVGAEAAFLPHHYPVVTGSEFRFEDSFQSTLLDYQWVFSDPGTYTIIPAQSTVMISSLPNGTAELYRGWGSLTDGFHPSTSAVVTLSFKFEGFSPGSSASTLANMTDGQLVVQTTSQTDFLYKDLINNNSILLSRADYNWHNFTIQYTEGMRIMMVDQSSWTLAGGVFARLMLGNTNSKPGYGGTAEFSNVVVDIKDFPAGYQSLWASALSITAPSILIGCLFFAISGRGDVLRRAKLPSFTGRE